MIRYDHFASPPMPPALRHLLPPVPLDSAADPDGPATDRRFRGPSLAPPATRQRLPPPDSCAKLPYPRIPVLVASAWRGGKGSLELSSRRPSCSFVPQDGEITTPNPTAICRVRSRTTPEALVHDLNRDAHAEPIVLSTKSVAFRVGLRPWTTSPWRPGQSS